MSENNWVKEAIEHFKKNGNKVYSDGDEISRKSKNINEKLKSCLTEKFNTEENKDVELNLQGSKWSVQGHKKLKDYIWYRANLKEFGEQYPIVFSIILGKNGLSFSIDIYNNAVNNHSTLEKLGKLLKEVIGNPEKQATDSQIGWIKRSKKYEDYGYFGLETFDDDKFNEVLEKYKEVA